MAKIGGKPIVYGCWICIIIKKVMYDDEMAYHSNNNNKKWRRKIDIDDDGPTDASAEMIINIWIMIILLQLKTTMKWTML